VARPGIDNFFYMDHLSWKSGGDLCLFRNRIGHIDSPQEIQRNDRALRLTVRLFHFCLFGKDIFSQATPRDSALFRVHLLFSQRARNARDIVLRFFGIHRHSKIPVQNSKGTGVYDHYRTRIFDRLQSYLFGGALFKRRLRRVFFRYALGFCSGSATEATGEKSVLIPQISNDHWDVRFLEDFKTILLSSLPSINSSLRSLLATASIISHSLSITFFARFLPISTQ